MSNPVNYYRTVSAAERAVATIVRRGGRRQYSSPTASQFGQQYIASPTIRPVPTYGASLRRGLLPQQNAQFSTSQLRPATIVTLNPRQDEEGQEMTIDITEHAAKRLREIAAKDKNPDLALRVRVESGGCHGFQYLMSLTSKKDFNAEDDTVFETEDKQARVVMDEPSLELLKGSKVDFTRELIGSQFKITGNPAATSSCGCGTSFDIKI